MIITENGRSRSVRTNSETNDILDRRLETLTEKEQAVFVEMLAQSQGDTWDDDVEFIESFLNQHEYDRECVSIEEWLEEPYYSGDAKKILYPSWRKDLVELFNGQYQEAILGGAIGAGKSYVGNYAVMRMIYECSCLRDPQTSYRLSPTDKIVFASLSVNSKNAQKVIFEGILDKMNTIPYFKNEFSPKKREDDLIFPKGIVLAAGASTDGSVIGLNIFGGVIEEANFFRSLGALQRAANPKLVPLDRAELLYAAIIRRMKSRYMTSGKLPGVLVMVSSKRTVNDFTEKRIRESRTDPFVFVTEHSLYEVKPEGTYSKKRFRVLVGDEKNRSKILNENETAPDNANVIEIPEDFRPDFDRDLEGSIRDIAGVATQTISSFIQKIDKVEEMFANSVRSHPFTEIDFDPTGPGDFDWDKLVERGPDGNWRPKINPQAVRHAHIDPSLTGDATGLVVAHISHWQEVVRRRTPGSDELTKEEAPFYVVDFVLRIIPPVGDEIQFKDVRRLIYDLSAHGFYIKLVTTDSYQHIGYSQSFKDKGYKSEVVSVDTSLDPYENVKLALYENRLKCYKYEPLKKELRYLEYDGVRRKVDHPKDGSKDVADALAGCLFTLSQRSRAGSQPTAPEVGVSEFEGVAGGVEEDDEFDVSWVLGNDSIVVDENTVIDQIEKPKPKTVPLMPIIG